MQKCAFSLPDLYSFGVSKRHFARKTWVASRSFFPSSSYSSLKTMSESKCHFFLYASIKIISTTHLWHAFHFFTEAIYEGDPLFFSMTSLKVKTSLD